MPQWWAGQYFTIHHSVLSGCIDSSRTLRVRERNRNGRSDLLVAAYNLLVEEHSQLLVFLRTSEQLPVMQTPQPPPNIPVTCSIAPYMELMETESPLWKKYLKVEHGFVDFLVSLELEDMARSGMYRMPTGEVVFVAYLGPNDLQNARAVTHIELYGESFVDKHFRALDIEPVYFRIFGTGHVGLL